MHNKITRFLTLSFLSLLLTGSNCNPPATSLPRLIYYTLTTNYSYIISLSKSKEDFEARVKAYEAEKLDEVEADNSLKPDEQNILANQIKATFKDLAVKYEEDINSIAPPNYTEDEQILYDAMYNAFKPSEINWVQAYIAQGLSVGTIELEQALRMNDLIPILEEEKESEANIVIILAAINFAYIEQMFEHRSQLGIGRKICLNLIGATSEQENDKNELKKLLEEATKIAKNNLDLGWEAADSVLYDLEFCRDDILQL